MDKKKEKAFSLVEILIVILVIGIITAFVFPQIRNARQASEEVIARQQQAELQVALGNWIVSASSGPGGLAAARTAYAGDKLALISDYLQVSTADSFSGSGDTVSSAALDGANAYLQFSAWSIGQQPTVQWINR